MPAGTSFISSSVCNPLKRAKSTVGVPLISETVVPFDSDRDDATLIWTENEVTLAIGASVPMTNAGPVTCSVTGLVLATVPAAARCEQRGSGEREECRWESCDGSLEQF